MHASFDSAEGFLNLDFGLLADWVIVVWDLRRAKPVIRYQIPAGRFFCLF
jgi:hypothetical protein